MYIICICYNTVLSQYVNLSIIDIKTELNNTVDL